MRLNYIFFKAVCLYGLSYQLSGGKLWVGLIPMAIFFGLYVRDLKNGHQ